MGWKEPLTGHVVPKMIGVAAHKGLNLMKHMAMDVWMMVFVCSRFGKAKKHRIRLIRKKITKYSEIYYSDSSRWEHLSISSRIYLIVTVFCLYH